MIFMAMLQQMTQSQRPRKWWQMILGVNRRRKLRQGLLSMTESHHWVGGKEIATQQQAMMEQMMDV